MGFIKACDHPNVIKIHKVRMDSTKTELYMKRYAYDLDKYMKKYGLIPIELIFSFARDLLDGIVHVHSKDIVHGDLKPQNILVDIIHR
jgi:serine/threonine protein kinase